MWSTALLLLAAPAFGQVLAPSPTESIGCTAHGDHWHCEGPAPAATGAAGLAPSPTESTGCTPHGDHWHCEAARTGSPTNASPSIPSPTDQGPCYWHETHWHCGEEEAAAEAASEGGECIIHVGHTHGDCSAEDLACGKILMENYNMGLHIGSVFIILVTSALGVFIPLIAGWTKSGGKKTATLDAASFGRDVGFFGNLLFVARHFGTGIIFSTAFIHLLYHGFVMFNNECLGHMSYEATAPAIALAATMITFLFDYLGSRSGHVRMKRRESETQSLSEGDTAAETDDREKGAPPLPAEHHHNHGGVDHTCISHAEAIFREEQDWQVVLLEAGIIFHSIMIGVTLGAGSGPGWTTLLIVLVFHQMFEGAALGARIALLYWIKKRRALLMGIAFILITPIGVAIGIGVRKSFSQNGKASLLSVGILNSISAGILLYTAFRLIIADFIDGPVRHARWTAVLVAFASMIVGLIAMSVLGKWA